MGNCLDTDVDPIEYFQEHDVLILGSNETDEVLTINIKYKNAEFVFRQYANGKTSLYHSVKGTCQYTKMAEYMIAIERVVAGGDLIVGHGEPHTLNATIWPVLDNDDAKEVRFIFLGMNEKAQIQCATIITKHCDTLHIKIGSMTLRQQMIAQMSNTQLEDFKRAFQKSNALTIRWTDLSQTHKN